MGCIKKYNNNPWCYYNLAKVSAFAYNKLSNKKYAEIAIKSYLRALLMNNYFSLTNPKVKNDKT
jgi:hypothetical protein